MRPTSKPMMTLAINDQRLAKPGPQNAALRDYDSVRRAIAFISEHWRAQPTIESVADAAGVTPDELHHLFRRWASLTPKAFMQALTLDHAKGLLRDSASVLDAALDSGLSGPGRLHDLFVTHEAMSPGEWKNGGAGMTLVYGFHPSAVGTAIGKNPVSFVVPCHRALGKSGKLTGYHWGVTRKQAMLGWEAGQVGLH